MNNTGENQCPADSLCCPSKALWPKIKVLRGWRTQFPFSVLHSAFQSIKFSVPKIQLLLKASSTNIFGNNKLDLGLLPLMLVQRVCSVSESVMKLVSSFQASTSSCYLVLTPLSNTTNILGEWEGTTCFLFFFVLSDTLELGHLAAFGVNPFYNRIFFLVIQ